MTGHHTSVLQTLEMTSVIMTLTTKVAGECQTVTQQLNYRKHNSDIDCSFFFWDMTLR